MFLLPALCYLSCFAFTYSYVRAEGTSSSAGREFIVAFPEHVRTKTKLQLLLTSAEDVNVNVNVSAPLMASAMSTQQLVLAAGGVAVVDVPVGLMLTGKGIFDRVLLVRSDARITVQALTTSTINKYKSVGAFLVLPVRENDVGQGEDYWVVTYCQKYSCCLVVSARHDATLVRITLRLPGTQRLKFDDVFYGNADVITLTLDAFQAVELMISADLTGSRVSANQSVAVVVGADYTTVGSAGSGDNLVESAPPASSWGSLYALLPNPGATEDTVVVVATMPNTTVRMGAQEEWLSRPGDSVTLSLNASRGSTLLTSDRRCVVAQLAQGRGQQQGDGTLLLLPPLSPGAANITWHVPEGYNASLELVADSSCLPDLLLNDSPVSTWSLTWDSPPVPPGGLAWLSAPLGEKERFLLSGAETCLRFSAHLFLSTMWKGAALPLVFPLLPDPTPTSSSLEVFDTGSSTSMVTVESATSAVLPSVETTLSTFLDTETSIEDSMSSTISISSWFDASAQTLFSSLEPLESDLVYSASLSAEATPMPSISEELSPSPTPVLVTPSAVQTQCACMCKWRTDASGSTAISSLVSSIVKSLAVNVSVLSSTRRRRESAADSRPTSASIGVVSVAILALVGVVIVLPDAVHASYYLSRVLSVAWQRLARTRH